MYKKDRYHNLKDMDIFQNCNSGRMSDCFAVRLKHGKAADEKAFEASLSHPKTEVKHMDSAVLEKMEIFGVNKILPSVGFCS
jgi:hypothetical protein